jgi:non-specific serine/threonine protein kinase
MGASEGEKAPSRGKKKSFFREFLARLRKQRIIETLAAFIGGGWLLIEVVERLLVGHYGFPGKTIDLTVVSVIGALLSTLVWRWFRGTEKRPGNVKIEVLLIPLIILVTLAIDLNLIFQITSIQGKKLLIGIVALCLGITWIFVKLYQWAASTPDAAAKKFDISKLAEIKPEKSIVVLPFVDLSPQKDQEYFCDGMTEEIITDLSYIHDLRLISRSSAMALKGSGKSVRDIAKELNVQYVLEGSVRKSGNDLRITAQLIDAANDAHLWAEKYCGELNDIFSIQEKVAGSIVNALKLKLTPAEQRRIAERPIDNIAAYECYLKAYHEIWRFTQESLDRALRYLEKALEIIGENAFIYSAMASAYSHYIDLSVKQEDYKEKAETCVQKALALDPDFPKAHTALGWIRWFSGNRQAAAQHFKHALAVNPGEFEALHGLAVVYVYSGKISAAAPLSERLIEMDPLNPISHNFQGAMYFWDGRFDLALERLRKAYQMDPENKVVQSYYVLTLARLNRVEEASSIIEKSALTAPNNIFTKWMLMTKYGLMKDKGKTLREMTPALKKICQEEIGGSYFASFILSLLDEKKEALDWLENAVDRGFLNYPMMAERDPFLANIRGEPRFKKLMERVKYEWEQFEV